MLNCSAALSSTISRRLRRGLVYSLIWDSAALTPSVVVGLLTKENAPRASACWRSSSSVMICTGMCRVSGLCLSWLSTVQPSMSGRNTSSDTAVGWTVLSQLKHNPLTRHIPVQIITLDDDRQHALARGAFSFVNKPTTTEGVAAALSQIKEYAKPRRKRLLIVEDNAAEQMSIRELLDHKDIEIITTDTGADALSQLRERPCDCVVLDLRLPDMTGFEVLDQIRSDDTLSNVPVVVFTGRELSVEEDAELHTMARSIVVKGVESPERLLDETSLFLHRVITELPIEKQRMLEKLNSSDEDLVGQTALLVDDDARNIFALSSVLERRGMKVLTATTGKEAIELVGSSPEIAIVLMDIMMPQMDGYQTIGVIREDPTFRRLPIIALTAK